jgi:nucleoid-associated protein YgaU
MKKYLLILLALAVASSLSLGAQGLKDNPDYLKSLELKDMATQAFDDGDYDAAAEYASQAKEYASLSDRYVEKMVAKASADKAIGQAKGKMAWADSINAAAAYPSQYEAAAALYDETLSIYDAEDYPTAGDKARETVAAVDRIAAAEAEAAIAKAKAAMGAAEAIEAPSNYPEQYGQAKTALADAQAAYDSDDFGTATQRANACVAALAGVKAKDKAVAVVPKDTWPAVYVVRLIPERRDCLWRIAEYPFIYNNPLKWPVIYDANKKTFRDPSNPNLIFPGQKLQIPAIKGETRAGTYDPSKTYAPLPKK